jgi:hypothetical protein
LQFLHCIVAVLAAPVACVAAVVYGMQSPQLTHHSMHDSVHWVLEMLALCSPLLTALLLLSLAVALRCATTTACEGLNPNL